MRVILISRGLSMSFFKRAVLCVGLLCLFGDAAFAQHEGHQQPPAKPAPAKPAPAKPAPAKPAPSPATSATPAPSPAEESMHAGMDHGLMVMEDDEMFVRVGDSHANL